MGWINEAFEPQDLYGQEKGFSCPPKCGHGHDFTHGNCPDCQKASKKEADDKQSNWEEENRARIAEQFKSAIPLAKALAIVNEIENGKEVGPDEIEWFWVPAKEFVDNCPAAIFLPDKKEIWTYPGGTRVDWR